MTNKKAIECLECIIIGESDWYSSKEIKEACEMAIKALEKEDKDNQLIYINSTKEVN